jgi:hypothetical protein
MILSCEDDKVSGGPDRVTHAAFGIGRRAARRPCPDRSVGVLFRLLLTTVSLEPVTLTSRERAATGVLYRYSSAVMSYDMTQR